jgi:hypothetical protein
MSSALSDGASVFSGMRRIYLSLLCVGELASSVINNITYAGSQNHHPCRHNRIRKEMKMHFWSIEGMRVME